MSSPEDPIRSRANATVKRARALARGGGDDDALWLEGQRLVRDAVEGGFAPEVVLVREDRARDVDTVDPAIVRVVDAGVFDSISSLRSADGIAAIVPRPEPRGVHSLIDERESLFLLGVHGVSDPGNVGALARAAEAAGVDGIVFTGAGARPYGPKALRGSMGSLLRVPFAEEDDVRALVSDLGRSGVRQFVASTRGGAGLDAMRGAPRRCVWVTSETGDAPDAFDGLEHVTIPMRGRVESLNVTVAGAILMFAAAGVVE